MYSPLMLIWLQVIDLLFLKSGNGVSDLLKLVFRLDQKLQVYLIISLLRNIQKVIRHQR